MKKWIYLCLIVSVAFILFCLIGPGPDVIKISPIGTMLAELATALGIFGVFYQFKSEKELNEADLIFRVNMEFIDNDSINNIYETLQKSKEKGQSKEYFSKKDHIDIANYLTQFELFNHLIDRRVIKMRTLDSILAYRFFLATNNKYVQENLLNSNNNWEEIFQLHRKWIEYRKRKKKIVWQSEYCLSETQPYKKFHRA